MNSVRFSIPGSAPLSREEYAYEALREAIVTGQYPPDQVLSQTEIASQLGISIIPVRSAISRLVSEGLMVQEPHNSPRVSSFSKTELREILTIRMHLEQLALREAMPRIERETIAALEQLAGEMDKAAAAGDSTEFGRLNKRFHLTIYAKAELPLLNEMITELWEKSDLHRGRAVFKLAKGQMQNSAGEHWSLISLMSAKDIEAASQALLEHKRRAMETFMSVLDHG